MDPVKNNTTNDPKQLGQAKSAVDMALGIDSNIQLNTNIDQFGSNPIKLEAQEFENKDFMMHSSETNRAASPDRVNRSDEPHYIVGPDPVLQKFSKLKTRFCKLYLEHVVEKKIKALSWASIADYYNTRTPSTVPRTAENLRALCEEQFAQQVDSGTDVTVTRGPDGQSNPEGKGNGPQKKRKATTDDSDKAGLSMNMPRVKRMKVLPTTFSTSKVEKQKRNPAACDFCRVKQFKCVRLPIPQLGCDRCDHDGDHCTYKLEGGIEDPHGDDIPSIGHGGSMIKDQVKACIRQKIAARRSRQAAKRKRNNDATTEAGSKPIKKQRTVAPPTATKATATAMKTSSSKGTNSAPTRKAAQPKRNEAKPRRPRATKKTIKSAASSVGATTTASGTNTVSQGKEGMIVDIVFRRLATRTTLTSSAVTAHLLAFAKASRK